MHVKQPLVAVLGTAAAVVVAGCGQDAVVARAQTAAKIAFTANQGGAGSVVVADPDGRRRVVVLRGARSPAWSPGGERLAVALERGEDTDLAVVNADGSGTRVLTSGPERDADPAFSPDGRRVAFARRTDSGDGSVRAAIHLIGADGTGLRRITPGDALDGRPAWSPDGRRLAFARVTVRGERLVAHVHVAGADGSDDRRLVEGQAPAWSPDGRRLLYVTGGDGLGRTCFHDCTPSGEIHVVGADGRGDRRLTRSTADDADPAWTADGRAILFSSDRSDRRRHDRELYAMTRSGACVTRLTNASSWSGEPAWRPRSAGRPPCERDGVASGAQRPVVDVDLRPARAFTAHRLLWLGATHRGLLLSHAARFDEGFDDQFWFAYDDCGRPRTASCPRGSLQVESRPLCWWRDSPSPVRLRRVGRERGAPVYAVVRGRIPRATAEVHTGDVAVRVVTTSRDDLRRALAALRPLDGERTRRLPPPARRCA